MDCFSVPTTFALCSATSTTRRSLSFFMNVLAFTFCARQTGDQTSPSGTLHLYTPHTNPIRSSNPIVDRGDPVQAVIPRIHSSLACMSAHALVFTDQAAHVANVARHITRWRKITANPLARASHVPRGPAYDSLHHCDNGICSPPNAAPSPLHEAIHFIYRIPEHHGPDPDAPSSITFGGVIVVDPDSLDVTAPAECPDLDPVLLAKDYTGSDTADQGVFRPFLAPVLPELHSRVRFATNDASPTGLTFVSL